jgi:hypothetical protein
MALDTDSVPPSGVHDPEKFYDSTLPPLSPVYSSASTLEDSLDVEANISAPAQSTDPEKSDDPGPPPNGGFHAWLQVLGSFFLFFNSW